MRKLTEQEIVAKNKAYQNWEPGMYTISSAFDAGFIAGLDYQQRKLDAYAAFVAGKITLKELEEVINA